MTFRALNSNLVIGTGMLGFGLAALVASLNIDLAPDGGWGARIFPLVGSGTLLVLGFIEALGGFKESAPASDDIKEPVPIGRVLSLLLLAISYFLLIGKMGYLISTSFAAVSVFLIFGVRKPFTLVSAAILAPTIYHLTIFVLLGVFPPFGEWFDLLDVIQGR